MVVLVSGGAGFIGSHLVEALVGRGYEVRVLDDFSTGKRSNLPHSDLVRIFEGDISDIPTVQAAMNGCSMVVHLAAIASVERSVRDPLGTHRTNLGGSLVLFEEAARAGVSRVVYASSAAVYGDTTELPIRETSSLRPLTPYAIDKLAGEQYLDYYHRTGKFGAVAFRFFNVYGPRQDPHSPYSGVISIFLDRAARGAQLDVYGDGHQSRDFVFVKDIVSALLAGLDQTNVSSRMPTYNVARGEQTSLLDLITTIESLGGNQSKLDVRHLPPREGDIRHSLADVRRLQHDLGWLAVTPLEQGLRAILQAE